MKFKLVVCDGCNGWRCDGKTYDLPVNEDGNVEFPLELPVECCEGEEVQVFTEADGVWVGEDGELLVPVGD